MTQFSNTRAADKTAAIGANPQLEPAIIWLRNNTPMCRLGHLEIYETLQAIGASGLWTAPKFNSATLP